MNKKKLFGELKIFEILKEEILDLDIKDCETNITIDRIAALTARLYEKGVAFQRFKPGRLYLIDLITAFNKRFFSSTLTDLSSRAFIASFKAIYLCL